MKAKSVISGITFGVGIFIFTCSEIMAIAFGVAFGLVTYLIILNE